MKIKKKGESSVACKKTPEKRPQDDQQKDDKEWIKNKRNVNLEENKENVEEERNLIKKKKRKHHTRK